MSSVGQAETGHEMDREGVRVDDHLLQRGHSFNYHHYHIIYSFVIFDCKDFELCWDN